MTTPLKTIWLVAHPLHQYVEDVKALARRHGLVIIDKAAAGDAERELAAEETPELTLRESAAKAEPPEAEKTAQTPEAEKPAQAPEAGEKPAQAPEKRTARTAST